MSITHETVTDKNYLYVLNVTKMLSIISNTFHAE